MPEDDELICADCGKSQGKKGSITQWMGLGEHCRCHLQADTSSHKKVKKDKQCRRCLKPKATASQSMTGWLFKRDFCKCQESTQRAGVQLKVAVPSTETTFYIGVSRKTVLVTGVVIVASVGVFFAMQLMRDFARDTLSAIEPLASKTGAQKERHILVGNTPAKGSEYIELTTRSGPYIQRMNYSYLEVKDASISDHELFNLIEPRCLKTVALNHCQGFSDIGLSYLVHRQNINALSLANSSLHQHKLSILDECGVASLDLSGTQIDDLDWSFISKLPGLQTLYLKDLRISAKNKDVLMRAHFTGENGVFRRHGGERYLKIGFMGEDDQHLIELTPDTGKVIDRTSYDYACLKEIKLTDKELTDLGAARRLSEVELSGCYGFTYVGLRKLLKANLLIVSLTHTELDQKMLDAFAFTNIVRLDLTDTKIDDKDWSFLAKMSELETLCVKQNKVTAANEKILKHASFVLSDGLYKRKRSMVMSKDKYGNKEP